MMTATIWRFNDAPEWCRELSPYVGEEGWLFSLHPQEQCTVALFEEWLNGLGVNYSIHYHRGRTILITVDDSKLFIDCGASGFNGRHP